MGVLGRVDFEDEGNMFARAFGVVGLLSLRDEEAEVVRREGPCSELRDWEGLTASVELLRVGGLSMRGLFPPVASLQLCRSRDIRERNICAV